MWSLVLLTSWCLKSCCPRGNRSSEKFIWCREDYNYYTIWFFYEPPTPPPPPKIKPNPKRKRRKERNKKTSEEEKATDMYKQLGGVSVSFIVHPSPFEHHLIFIFCSVECGSLLGCPSYIVGLPLFILSLLLSLTLTSIVSITFLNPSPFLLL